jgi:hypothetical protein
VGEGADAVPTAVKALPIAAGLIALSLGIVGAIVFGLGDADTFVSPPEIVAEELVRALGHGRIEPARSMLASDAERTTSKAEVRRMSDEFRSRLGDLQDVKGTVTARSRDTAIVRARVEGERANTELTLPLVREHGAWAVADITEMLAPVRQLSAPRATRR